MLTRYQLFSKRRDHVFAFGDSVEPPKVSTELVDRVSAEETARAKLAALRTEGAGRDTSFYQYHRGLLRFPAIGQPFNMISYTVPAGRVLEVESIEFVLSEPWLYGSYQFGWRLAINAEQINNQGTRDGIQDDYLFTPIPLGPGQNANLFPVFVTPTGVMQVQVREINPAGGVSFDQMVWVSVAVKGRLRKPAGGRF